MVTAPAVGVDAVEDGGRDPEHPSGRCGPGGAFGGDDLAELRDGDGGKRISWSLHSSSRLRGGAGSLGRSRLGDTHRNGASARIRIPMRSRCGRALAQVRLDPVGDERAVQGGDVGGVDGVQQHSRRRRRLVGWCAARCRPAGPLVPGSRSMPALRASSWSGIQSPVNTTVSQSMMRRRPVSRFSTSTPCRAGLPMIRTTRVRVATGDPEHRLARHVERGVGLRGGIFGGHQRRWNIRRGAASSPPTS